MVLEEVRRYGIVRPIYYWEGEIIDGRETLRAARTLGIEVPMVIDFENEPEAMHYLATVHPERALKRWPCASASEASRRFDVPLRVVARFFQPPPKRKRVKPGRPARRTGKRTRAALGGAARHVYLSDQVWAKAEDDAALIGVSRSEYIRAALQCVSPETVRSKLVALSLVKRRQ